MDIRELSSCKDSVEFHDQAVLIELASHPCARRLLRLGMGVFDKYSRLAIDRAQFGSSAANSAFRDRKVQVHNLFSSDQQLMQGGELSTTIGDRAYGFGEQRLHSGNVLIYKTTHDLSEYLLGFFLKGAPRCRLRAVIIPHRAARTMKRDPDILFRHSEDCSDFACRVIKDVP